MSAAAAPITLRVSVSGHLVLRSMHRKALRVMVIDDYGDEIPQRAYINAEVLQLAVKTAGFQDCLQHVETKYGLGPYAVINPVHVISLLYCLVVVPKELWLTEESEVLHMRLAQLHPEKLFVLERTDASFSARPAAELIRHLRNSVAYANFSVARMASSGSLIVQNKVSNLGSWRQSR